VAAPPQSETNVSSPVRGASSSSILIADTFGPTWQGEGPHTGRYAAFIRLGGCHLHCGWCDEPQTWVFDKRHAAMHDRGRRYDPAVVLKRVEPAFLVEFVHQTLPEYGCVVITGGEPMLQKDRLSRFLRDLFIHTGAGHCIEIETSGTVRVPVDGIWGHVRWNVSPKLAHSGNTHSERYKPDVLADFVRRDAIFKFVVKDVIDFVEIREIVSDIGIPNRRVWIMPEGTVADTQLHRMRDLAEDVLRFGWNLSPRLHVLIWEGQSGR
jgi:7-carboxy-7-deazaguanine synthase